MKTTSPIAFAVIIIFFLAFASCNKDSDSTHVVTTTLDLPTSPYTYGTSNDRMVTLGRVLFYDAHLSANNSVSCASCHKQAYAFADNAALSKGFENKLTSRNSIAIQNLQGNSFFIQDSSRLFWDGRETFLPNMVLRPMLNHVEMGMGSLSDVVKKVKAQAYYQDLFNDAFGLNDEINESSIGYALSSFVGAIQSTNSKFDAVNEGLAQLTGKEHIGMDLFFNRYNCNSCHRTQEPGGYPTGNGLSGFVNIGLNSNYTDNGRGKLTGNPADYGKFKIPNLRNIVLTAPYMHDGRFSTLAEVIDHYSTGIVDHPNLDSRLKNGNNPVVLNISVAEKEALLAFLNTMTDVSLITDSKYSNPFKSK